MSARIRSEWLAHGIAIGCLVGGVLVFAVPADPTREPTGSSGDSWGSVPGAIGLALFVLVTLFAGWLIARKRPENSLGWIMLAITASFAILAPLVLVGVALIPVNEVAASWFLMLGGANSDSNTAWVLPIGLLMTQLPLRFPTGRLPSPRWRWFSWFTIVAMAAVIVFGNTTPSAASVGYGVASPVTLPWGEAEVLGFVVTFSMFGAAMVGSLASLIVRYRGADAVERAQLRWVYWGAAFPILLLIASWIVSALSPQDAWINTVGVAIIALCYSMIPAAILVAVMRYGLYSIDRIISRTASYAIVVVLVVGTYAGLVVGLTSLLPGLPSVGVAVATLGAAALFLPALRVVQRGVDRRFNRSAYDAQRVVDNFGRHVRDGADPAGAVPELTRAIEQTLEPTSLGVWMRGMP
ncbi:MAG: hypothetical protein DI566_04565 [Microbacterium sp.]|nr:MAG: hypothetical protein DI566_04565 [Microbacterium sp.]